MSLKSKNTACVHAGTLVDKDIRGLNTPIHTSTAFEYLELEEVRYPRYFNTPNTESLNSKLAALEQGEAGLVFSSGMAAISTTLFAFLNKGDHAIFQKGLYGGTFQFVTRELEHFGIGYDITPSNEPEEFEKLIKPATKLIFIETPSNPLLYITDIQAIADICKTNNLISVTDNTFASPINQNPLMLGIDIVTHSATKYLGGHSDICAGAVICPAEKMQKIRKLALSLGGSLNALTCYLLERSIKTLGIRIEKQNDNAGLIAGYLDQHPGVLKVNYPGLPDHPGHETAKKQMSGFGGMLSFELGEKDPVAFQHSLKMIRPAVSLGGVDTIVCSPFLTSHRHLSPEEKTIEGIGDNLIRLSAGIEAIEDITDDLEQALK
jgi:cystathionine beta-lyase